MFIGIFQILLLTIITSIIIIPIWVIFSKANQPGWASIIPIYSSLVWLKIIGKPWYWLILFIIPYLNLVFIIWSINLMSKSFGKDESFTVGLVLLPIIFYPILAFGNSKYIGPSAS